MERGEGDFLKDRYWDSPAFREATDISADRTERREGEKVPHEPSGLIENYLDRFSEITDREDPEKRERGIAAIERLVERKFVIIPDNISDDYIKNVLIGNEAEILGYEREEMKDEQIAQTVLSSLEGKINSSLDTYTVPIELRKSLEDMIIIDQTSRMKQWLSYLTGEESRYIPAAFRYWAFAEMLKQGDYDPVRGEYNKRTDTTVAIFPELDQQALALVLDEVQRRRSGQPPALSTGDHESQAKLRELLQDENFGKLYAFMQEHVRSLKLPSERLVVTEGEWKVFPQGSQPRDLTAPIESFQTKWCIAGEGHAKTYLNSSDVWVYFSQDADGQNTIPRACVVDQKGHGITEVRGIIFNEEVKQHLDDYITPVVDEKLKEMAGGEEWVDRMEDMKKLRELHFKYLQEQPLNKDDLIFLYELNHSIQSTGYGQDPRISELRSQRNPEADMPIVFECEPSQIAHSIGEINEDTKACVGPIAEQERNPISDEWELKPEYKNVIQKLAHLEHIYTNFPEGKIDRSELTIGGVTVDQMKREMRERKITIGSRIAEFTLDSTPTLEDPEDITLIRLKVGSLGFTRTPTTEEFYARAEEIGLELCPTETGPHQRLKDTEQPLGESYRIAIKQIDDRNDYPDVFHLVHDVDGLCLHLHLAYSVRRWNLDERFVFCLRPSTKPGAGNVSPVPEIPQPSS
ncbi:MAG: hypothetical protein NUV80_07105 [Candidatus Berkelbacteria bacterium]|nr:hypothetical protein [Candidatus Berkelbacteria bacterium]